MQIFEEKNGFFRCKSFYYFEVPLEYFWGVSLYWIFNASKISKALISKAKKEEDCDRKKNYSFFLGH
jgi:hypothetical protein